MPVFLVAGVVHHLDGIACLGEIRRARWSSFVPEAVRGDVDVALVGTPANGEDPRALLQAVRRERHNHHLPLLHLAPRLPCVGCVADVCLPADARPETLRDVCRILLDVRRSLRGTARPERRQIPERDPAPRAETLSQLAAGVAHDFSDVLDVISGQAQLAQELLPAGHPARERLDLIFGASQRAAGLTRQLLALGREPQSQPEPLDFHDVVTSFARLLEHVIGAGVEVEMRRARTAGIVLADRAQIEQILLELALNALDATPRAGRLLFETADVDEAPASGEGSSPRPGPHVRLCVSSGGLGMNLETRQVFDRPGTSRQPAQEASLGLANVRRIVSECGGVVRLDGARGLGTVAVYLPRMVGLSSEAGPAPRDTPKEREGDPTSTRRHAAAS